MGGKMRKPVISIKLSSRMYSALVDLGNRIFASMTGNVNFTTPSPTLLAIQTAVTDVMDAIAAWGPKGNRGSHDDLVNLRLKAQVLRDMLKAEAQYVQNTAQAAAGVDYPTMGTIITSSGFALANDHTPQGVLQKVQNLHLSMSRKLNPNQVKLLWKKPLNVLTAGNVKSYRVLRNTSADITTATEVAITTRRSFIDVNTGSASVEWTYWVVPYNTNGAGAISDAISVAVLGV